MKPIATELNRELPIIVDDQNGAISAAKIARLFDLLFHNVPRLVFDPQLNQFHPQGQHAPQPVGVIEYRIETIQGHDRKAFPMTGVEASAISRASIGSA